MAQGATVRHDGKAAGQALSVYAVAFAFAPAEVRAKGLAPHVNAGARLDEERCRARYDFRALHRGVLLYAFLRWRRLLGAAQA